jgi:hypothetical protein
MSISGGRNDTVMHNSFTHNGAWGVIFVPYPDSGPPCTGGTLTPVLCLYDDWGDALIDNTFGGNGFFGNPTNGDFAVTNLEPGPTDCFRGNVELGGGSLKATPSYAEQLYPSCNGQTMPPSVLNPQSLLFTDEVACDSDSVSIGPLAGGTVCLPGSNYPRHGKGQPMPALPTSSLSTMPNPCAGVPTNPWCPAGSRDHKRRRR